MGNLRLLVVDDHDVVRQGLRALLKTHPGWEICGEAATGHEALEKSRKLEPDVAILDISLPGLSGLEVARQIQRLSPATQILVLTVDESEDLMREVFRIGARGFVVKSDAGRDLVAAIETVSQRKPYFSRRVVSVAPRGDRFTDRPRASFPAAAPEHLSPREREILELLAGGHGNRQIAARLQISVKTVEAHRANLMHKLGLHSISQLTRYAIRNGMIQA